MEYSFILKAISSFKMWYQIIRYCYKRYFLLIILNYNAKSVIFQSGNLGPVISALDLLPGNLGTNPGCGKSYSFPKKSYGTGTLTYN